MATSSKRRKTSKSKSLIRKVKSGGQNTLLTVAGFGLAHEVSKYAGKLLNPAGNGTTSGVLSNAKSYTVPGALILLGIFAPELSSKYAKYLRPIGGGMAAYGGATALKQATGMSVLSGTPSLGMLHRYSEPHPIAMLNSSRFSEHTHGLTKTRRVAL